MELGADGVELDVHRTLDDALVVRHDADGPPGVWAELTLDAIRAAAPDVPVLAEVLDVCAGKLVNVEIKNSPRDLDWDPTERAADLVVECLAVARRHRHGAGVVVRSPDGRPRADARRPRCRPRRSRSPAIPLDALLTAETHGHRALHPFVGQLAGGIVGALVQRAHERGIQVNVWTVNEPDDIVRLGSDRGRRHLHRRARRRAQRVGTMTVRVSGS